MERDSQKRVLPFFWPPSLILRQLGCLLYYGSLLKWMRLPRWLWKSGIKTLPVASGAYGMGCIGFPAHPVWEITSGCNLMCIHCHASSGKPRHVELTTGEGLQLLDEIASVGEFRMLVLTGGEPLVRRDIFEILAHAKNLRLKIVIATNGTLVDEETAFQLKESGVVGLAISLDSFDARVHNFIRNSHDAFARARKGIEYAKKAGLVIQINFTAMEYNSSQLAETIDLVGELETDIMLIYQLIPVGRGKSVEESALRMQENQRLVRLIKEKQVASRTIIEPVAAPQHWPYLLMGKENRKLGRNLAETFFHGCTAGRGLVYIKANGEVWPCPFVEVPAGNVKEASFPKIWRESGVFQQLRQREKSLKGRCQLCQFVKMCGGCRGRAWALKGDYLAEDPSCFIRNGNTKH